MRHSVFWSLAPGVLLVSQAVASDEWKRHVIATGFSCQTAVAADFTGDGMPDVIADAQGETHLYVAPYWDKVIIDGKWPFRPGERDTIHSEVMDVDQDGDPDYIGAVYSPGPVFWLERPDNPLSDRWLLRIVDGDVNGTHGLVRGDIDGDGREDLAGNSAQPKDAYPNSLIWWRIPANPRSAEEWVRHVFADQDAPGLSHYLGIGDLDGDGVGGCRFGRQGCSDRRRKLVCMVEATQGPLDSVAEEDDRGQPNRGDQRAPRRPQRGRLDGYLCHSRARQGGAVVRGPELFGA